MHQFIIEVGRGHTFLQAVDKIVEGGSLTRTTMQLRVGVILAHKGRLKSVRIYIYIYIYEIFLLIWVCGWCVICIVCGFRYFVIVCTL